MDGVGRLGRAALLLLEQEVNNAIGGGIDPAALVNPPVKKTTQAYIAEFENHENNPRNGMKRL